MPRLEFGHQFHAPETADDVVSPPQIAEFPANRTYIDRTVRHCGFDDDGGVHSLPVDGNPFALDTHERLMVRRRVEVVRGAAIPICWDKVDVVGARDAAAERDELVEQLRQIR